MHLRSDLISISISSVILLAAASAPAFSQSEAPTHADVAPPAAARTETAPDSVSPERRAMFDRAFSAASKIPFNPHERDKSRAQEGVALAVLRAGDLEAAIRYADRMEGWRQASVQADIAIAAIERGGLDATAIDRLVVDAAKGALNATEWRRDRIRAKLGVASELRGQREMADGFITGTTDAEAGRVDVVRSRSVAAADVPGRLSAMEEIGASGHFEKTRFALLAAVEMHKAHFGDAVLRDRIEESIVASWAKMPLAIRFEVLVALVDTALERGDQTEAASLVARAVAMLGDARWSIDADVQWTARVAERRVRIGEDSAAREMLVRAIERYEAGRATIIDIDRAATLRPVLQAWAAIGDAERTRELLAKTLEEGAVNPNARPRAIDLAATLALVAERSITVDAQLAARIDELMNGLVDPW
jgi:hypothetical protein